MTLRNHEWLLQPAARPDEACRAAAWLRQAQLTKPPGALGRLEELAVTLAALQGVASPSADRVGMVIFAGDHGVAEEGVSAFPQAVTAEMLKNFDRGGAAICVLAKALAADLQVINLGTVFNPGPLPSVRTLELGPGTANFTQAPAMTPAQLSAALTAGREAAQRCRAMNMHLFIGGEMGIGNTTAAAALACALLSESPGRLAGPGTGIDAAGVAHKASVIGRALAFHGATVNEPLEALRRLGGLEIAALVGAYTECAQAGVPVLVDGFICTVAALAAVRHNPGVADWLILAHASAEPGHRRVVAALDARPVLDLGLRLGEGSGAAVAVPLLRLACTLHNGMATFADAGVSEKL